MSRLEKAVALVAALLWVGAAHATDPVVKCQEKKLKAQGKFQLCREKNRAKVLGGTPDALASCQAKLAAALGKAGTACRYLDNGDGTVTDLDTGLQWEKKGNLDSMANTGDPHDADNSYSWSTSGTAPDGTAFTDFLAKLNNGASPDNATLTPITGCFTGHCDWRLPSIVELQAILDPTQGACGGGSGACIDPAFGPTQADVYWSATTDSGLPPTAWIVFFGTGAEVNFIKSLSGSVRAVRGGL